jgi:hypothetical protein
MGWNWVVSLRRGSYYWQGLRMGMGVKVCDEQKAIFCGSFDTIRNKRKKYAEV